MRSSEPADGSTGSYCGAAITGATYADSNPGAYPDRTGATASAAASTSSACKSNRNACRRPTDSDSDGARSHGDLSPDSRSSVADSNFNPDPNPHAHTLGANLLVRADWRTRSGRRDASGAS